MATTTCARCLGTQFEIFPHRLPNYDYEVSFVQCSNCGTVIGVTTIHDAGMLGKENQEKVAELKQQLSRVESRLASIQEQLDLLNK